MLQLGGRFVREGKSHNVGGKDSRLVLGVQQSDDASGYHFRLTRACTRNQLQIPIPMADSVLLVLCEFHEWGLGCHALSGSPLRAKLYQFSPAKMT